MASARELLQQELQRRSQQSQIDDNAIRNDIAEKQAMAEIDPSFRRPMKNQAAFMDSLNDRKIGLADNIKDPTTTEQAINQAHAAQRGTPKQNLLAYLQAQVGNENADAKAYAKANKTKEMSGEARKRMGSTRMALDALDDMETALGRGSSILPEFVTGPTGDNMLTEARRRFVEGFGRGQSGAAISDEERANFARMAPRFSDSEEIRQMKFDRMRNELQLRMSELGGGSYTPQQSNNGHSQDGNTFDMGTMDDASLDAEIKRLEALGR